MNVLFLDLMTNDSSTTQSIEYKNHVSGVANLLTKYGFATLATENIELFLKTLEMNFGIKAYVAPRAKGVLREGEYFIKEMKKK